MIFSSFFDEFPELVESEFRNIFVFDNDAHKHIPPGNYAFLEMFCPDIECDCRKVIIHVISANPAKKWAILNYGWESEEYYKAWWGKSHEVYKKMSGVTFDPPSKNSLEIEFLEVFQDLIRHDKKYAKRIESHYYMFKEKMREKKNNAARIHHNTKQLIAEKTGRNDPCPCNSGKKFKKCCLLSALN
jgi:hypothetical protein